MRIHVQDSSPTPVHHPRRFRLHTPTCCGGQVAHRAVAPQPHMRNPYPGITHTWFSLIRYRSPLHTESHLFSSPAGTEMFHFPALTPIQAMHSPAGRTTQLVRGFPIRTSSDQRFVGNSPRHNAASHVLHRPSMPRHPPYALDQQTHTITTHHTHHTACTMRTLRHKEKSKK